MSNRGRRYSFPPKRSSTAGARKATQRRSGTKTAVPKAPCKLPDSKTAEQQKEIKQLRSLIVKLTSDASGIKVKRLYFTEGGLAKRWSMSVKHIQRLRYQKKGPKVTRFGRSVRYRLRDILAYEKLREDT